MKTLGEKIHELLDEQGLSLYDFDGDCPDPEFYSIDMKFTRYDIRHEYERGVKIGTARGKVAIAKEIMAIISSHNF